MRSADVNKSKGKIRRAAEKIVDRKLEIADRIVDRKLEIVDGFTRRKQRNREKIRLAVGELLAKVGVDKVSINDIASRARVSQVTIYNLFGSKDELIYDYMQNLANSYIEGLREIMEFDKPYPERIEHIFRWGIEASESHPEFDELEALNSPGAKQIWDSVLEKYQNLVLKFIKEGKEEGYLNPELSDEAIEVYLQVIFAGMRANPQLHARTHHNSKIFHDFLVITVYGFSRIDNLYPARELPSPRPRLK